MWSRNWQFWLCLSYILICITCLCCMCCNCLYQPLNSNSLLAHLWMIHVCTLLKHKPIYWSYSIIGVVCILFLLKVNPIINYMAYFRLFKYLNTRYGSEKNNFYTPVWKTGRIMGTPLAGGRSGGRAASNFVRSISPTCIEGF
jgi:hypothetical protein